MKKFLLPLLTILSVSVFAQSDNELLPYNPDFDGDGLIGSPDLLGFLPAYGEAFQPNGVLPVELGGTGVTSLDSLKLDLGLSVFEEIVSLGDGSPSGLVQGDIIISGTLSQGDGCVASGAYANASGRFSTASGFYSNAANQNCSALGICSSAEGEGSTAISTASHSEGFQTTAQGTGSHAEGYQSETSANYAHAEGYQTEATNIASHSEGWNTSASGLYSHAENRNTVTTSTFAHPEG